MLFKQKDLVRIKAGEITLAFRKWKKLSVNVGSQITTSIGLIRINSIAVIDSELISDADAKKAGFASAFALKQLLNGQKDGSVYQMSVTFEVEDPRLKLREISEMDETEFSEIKSALESLDKFSKVGKWTTKVLLAIQENPRLRAADLAVKAKKEKEWLKLNIRKLKALGLTISHEPGYTLSPRGEAYLAKISSR